MQPNALNERDLANNPQISNGNAAVFGHDLCMVGLMEVVLTEVSETH